MAGNKDGAARRSSVEKRGGYESSSRPATSLKPPPSALAPGATKPMPQNGGSAEGK